MSKVFLTPYLIAALVLLPGCTSNEVKACNAAEQAVIEYELESADKLTAYNNEINKNQRYDSSLSSKAAEAYLNSLRVIVNNPSCFTPKQVAEAQSFLSKVK